MHTRFYAPNARTSGDLVSLPDDEARHLTRVLRLEAGDAISVFDGRGHEFDAVVAESTKSRVMVRLGSHREPAPEPRVTVTLAQAVLKGDKMDDVVRDAVMIGVAAIQPIVTARTEVSLAVLARGRRVERWQRIAVSAAKQCGRAVVPPVLGPIEVSALFAAACGGDGPALVFAEPSTGTATPLAQLDAAVPGAATIIVGPEGGWMPEELSRAVGCRFVRLGDRTLRADAMAVVAMSALFAHWREF